MILVKDVIHSIYIKRFSHSENFYIRTHQNPLVQDLISPLIPIMFAFHEHIIDKSNRQQIQLGHRKTELFASQEKKWSCHRADILVMFFRLNLYSSIQSPQFDKLRKNLLNAECVKLFQEIIKVIGNIGISIFCYNVPFSYFRFFIVITMIFSATRCFHAL